MTIKADDAAAIKRSDVPTATFPQHLTGSASAVEALLERVLPGSASQFELSIEPRCPGIPAGKACFTLADSAGKTRITGTSASEITGGLGIYLREHCNMTIGWPRGGGSRVFTPSPWPRVGAPISRARSVPYSHVTQVCTHSCEMVTLSRFVALSVSLTRTASPLQTHSCGTTGRPGRSSSTGWPSRVTVSAATVCTDLGCCPRL